MTSKKNNELTPATLENMPVGQKITAYEEILHDQERFGDKLNNIVNRGTELLRPTGKTFVGYYQKSDIKVPKKREIDPVISAFAQRIGNSVSSILANGSTDETTLEKYLGQDSYAKLKAIAEEYSVLGYGTKNVDQKESERIWLEYTKLQKEYQDAQEGLAKANRRMDQANQYVSYVQKLAEVASKTKRLMQ
jgi:hypothetical protein